MPLAAEKTMFQNPQDETRGGSTTEMWEVFPTTDGGVYDPTGFVDATQIYTGVVLGLPTRGSLHPQNPAFGLCTALRVSEVKSKSSVLVLVFYRSYGLFIGGPVTTADTTVGEDGEFFLPVFRSIIPPVGPPSYFLAPISESRAVMERRATLFMNGGQAQADLVSDAIATNIGRYYTIAGRLYRLHGGFARYDGVSRVRVEYAFRTTAEYSAIPVNATGIFNAIAIPYLPQMYKYAINTSANPPTITACPPSGVSLFGATLPGPYP